MDTSDLVGSERMLHQRGTTAEKSLDRPETFHNLATPLTEEKMKAQRY